jgi:Holliday junction resolvase
MNNYQKGARKERKLVNTARSMGLTSLRSAGSHSPIDVVIIDHNTKTLLLVQCKPDNYPQSQIDKLMEENKHLNGTFQVSFVVQ